MSMQNNNDASGYIEAGERNVSLIYILYLVSFIVGVTVLIGLVFAYMNRGKVSGWVDSHYTYQIRTFWMGLLFGFVSMLLMFVGIGFLLMFVVAIWMIVRCVKGLQAAGRREAIANPQTWLF